MSWSDVLTGMAGGFGLGVLLQYELGRWGDRIQARRRQMELRERLDRVVGSRRCVHGAAWDDECRNCDDGPVGDLSPDLFDSLDGEP